MDKHHEGRLTSKSDLQRFTHFIFQDIKALELLIENNAFEKGITRVGAEQEVCLINSFFRPAPTAGKILDLLKDDHQITNELPKFNLEINLSPRTLEGSCLSQMERELKGKMKKLCSAGVQADTNCVLVGILPTIRQSDLILDNMTPNPRYLAINDVLRKMRGSDYEVRIQGTDELMMRHDTIMFETCNTSFQVHYQVDEAKFVDAYNWAQVIAAPTLAVATNSPLLLGKRLWRETRIALFQQSTDVRKSAGYIRDQEARVLFGNHWVTESVAELFKEDVARHRVLIASDIHEDSVQTIREGRIPELKALRLHNGTVYKWNRPCYGIMNGKPHLRIENRVLPSGPTVIDEMANATFWIGLMHGMPKAYTKLYKKFDFDLVKTNFFRAAQMGMGTAIRWLNNKHYNVQDLVINELLPLAREGLHKAHINKDDIDRYLGVIEDRTKTGRTGSQWILDSFNTLKTKSTADEAMVALTAGMAARQKRNIPVHRWAVAKIDEAGSWVNRYWRIDQIMSRNLYTVKPDDLVGIIPNLMNWKNISYVPVEGNENELVGLVTYRELLRFYANYSPEEQAGMTVQDIMITQPISINDETLTIDAINLMRRHKIGSLPVVKGDNKLVGIVTKEDFVNVADHFLQEFWSRKKDQK